MIKGFNTDRIPGTSVISLWKIPFVPKSFNPNSDNKYQNSIVKVKAGK
jgi:hypothetical protein